MLIDETFISQLRYSLLISKSFTLILNNFKNTIPNFFKNLLLFLTLNIKNLILQSNLNQNDVFKDRISTFENRAVKLPLILGIRHLYELIIVDSYLGSNDLIRWIKHGHYLNFFVLAKLLSDYHYGANLINFLVKFIKSEFLYLWHPIL